MQTPTPQPPPQPFSLRLALKDLRFNMSAGAFLALSAIIVMVPTGLDAVRALAAPPPPLDGALPLQQWTADVSPRALTAFTIGALPAKPLPGQITTATSCRWPGTLKNGGCWIEVGNTSPPCRPPANDPGATPLYDDGGKCWAPVLRAQQPPTTGELRPGNVAGAP